MVWVIAHQRRHIERSRQTGLACLQQEVEAPLVSSGEPKPANMRIVHSLPRYMLS